MISTCIFTFPSHVSTVARKDFAELGMINSMLFRARRFLKTAKMNFLSTYCFWNFQTYTVSCGPCMSSPLSGHCVKSPLWIKRRPCDASGVDGDSSVVFPHTPRPVVVARGKVFSGATFAPVLCGGVSPFRRLHFAHFFRVLSSGRPLAPTSIGRFQKLRVWWCYTFSLAVHFLAW